MSLNRRFATVSADSGIYSNTGTTANTFTVDSDSVTGQIVIDVALGAADKALTLTNTALTDDRTITFQDADGTVAFLSDVAGAASTVSNTFTVDTDSAIGKIVIEVTTGAADKALTITNAALTDDVTITLPNATGTLATLDGAEALTNKTNLSVTSQSSAHTNSALNVGKYGTAIADTLVADNILVSFNNWGG